VEKTVASRADVWSRNTWAVMTAVLVLSAIVLRRQQGAFGFYDDEGITLLKALMVERGFPLYTQVYSDQPPLYTWLMVPLVRWLSPTYEAAQGVALLMGLATVGAAFAIAAELDGWAAGVCSAVVLLLLAPFVKFATSVVITIPALCLGSWALFLAVRRAPASWSRSAGCGVLFGLATCTKVAVAYFLPVLLLALLCEPGNLWPRGRLLWFAAGGAVPIALVLGLAPTCAMASQLFRPHIAAYWAAFSGVPYIPSRREILLAPGLVWLYAAALALLILLVWQRRPGARVLAAWAAVVGTWELLLRPLWMHHLPDLLLPLSVCLAVGAVSVVRELAAAPGRWAAAVYAVPVVSGIVGLAVHVAGWGEMRKYYDSVPLRGLREVSAAIASQTASDDFILVDRPIVAVLAGRRVPPALAMISRKRILAGELGEPTLLEALHAYRPRMIAFCSEQFGRFPGFANVVRAHYRQVQRFALSTEFLGAARSCRLLARVDRVEEQ
jgi:4-amino-4-deoxy-L-arabinose transferase-like glycosyltransferase